MSCNPPSNKHSHFAELGSSAVIPIIYLVFTDLRLEFTDIHVREAFNDYYIILNVLMIELMGPPSGFLLRIDAQ